MDILSRAPHRATVPPGQTAPEADVETRFRALVQSPLRAGLLRFLNARPHESHDLEALMAAFGRLRLDVDNCLAELIDSGFVEREAGPPPRFGAVRPADEAMADQLDRFLQRRAAVSTEDQSPSVQRFREMLGRDEKMLILFEWIRTAAKSDIAVLVLGPTGSGKEIVAKMIHDLSRRGGGTFQAVNCAALPDTLFESELFGFEKGAFTGAHDRKPGRLEQADQGTLFLDEIGDLSLAAQAKLLRVLEERRFERLGGTQSVEVDFRLVSATNRPLDELVGDGRFREDLLYRVNAFAIRLPSLRERPIDIPILAARFVARYCAGNGLPLDGKVFAPEALARLQAYPWPGNIRELESTVSRAALSAPGRIIRDTDIEFLHPLTGGTGTGEPARLATLAEVEQAHIRRVLDSVAWTKKEAARVLGISRGTLYRKIGDFGLESPDRVPDAESVR